MEAPPVPPRINEVKLWNAGFRPNQNGLSSPIANVVLQQSQSHQLTSATITTTTYLSQNSVTRASTPPPLPPRRWVDSSVQPLHPNDINELLLVPPPPSQTSFKSPNSDLMSFSSPNLQIQPKINPFSFVSSSSAPRPVPNGVHFPVVAPPNSPSFFSTAVSNDLYFYNVQHKYSKGDAGSTCSKVVQRSSWDIPHSHSAPDLAQLQYKGEVNKTESTQQLIANAMNFMKKKQDSNLIDLFSENNEFAKKNLLGKALTSADVDILKLFDPLRELDINESSTPQTEGDTNFLETTIVADAAMNDAFIEDDVPADQTDGRNTKTKISVSDPIHIDLGKVTRNIKPKKNGLCSENFGALTVLNRSINSNAEINNFAKKVKSLRREFTHNDNHTNVGLVISPTLENNREDPLSIQLTIESLHAERPVSFTCDVSTSIEHVISHVVCAVFEDTSAVAMDDYVLQVDGISEYLASDTVLADYEYVHQCHKFDKPVRLKLVEAKELRQDLARSAMDDKTDINFHPSELLDEDYSMAVDCATVNILLETLHKEMNKLRQQAKNVEALLYPDSVTQAVKAICATLCCIETLEINSAVEDFNLSLLKFAKYKASFPTSDSYIRTEMLQLIDSALLHLLGCVEQVLRLYCQAFRVNFEVPGDDEIHSETRDVTTLTDTLLFQLSSLHNIPKHWSNTYESYALKVELRHGQNIVAKIETQRNFPISKVFFERLVFEEWLQFDDIPMHMVPREASLYFFLYGIGSAIPEADQTQIVLLGWTATTLFDHDHILLQGSCLLGLWPEHVDPKSGPTCPNQSKGFYPLLRVNMPEHDFNIKFPNITPSETMAFQGARFELLETAAQSQISRIIGTDLLGLLSEEEKELLWEKRHFLQDVPNALPKLLFSVQGWDSAYLPEIYSALQVWKPLTAVESLVLLLPDFPDTEIRKTAIKWTKSIGSDELCDYLPQLVQVLKFETWLDSHTVWFLLERALTSVRVGHHLYWLLKQNLDDPLSSQRMRLVLNALNIILGSSLRRLIQRENVLLGSLSEVAEKIKGTKESFRLTTLLQELETTHHILQESPTCLPLSPSLRVCKIDVKNCSYFTSNTLPLKIVFRSIVDENHCISAIYKVGDDLRQDMLTLQMIRIMDKLWLKEGLDLKIVTFGCFATAYKEGMVEMVTDAETLRKIQTEHGLTGSFKDRPIAEWLQKHNTSELEYQQAVENFTLSCAGYCVATYLLGIGDRHNDNIMLKTSGHIFHIDFGKFLGDSQMFGNIKRDRAPFVLTSDMAYVINGGDKPSKRFQDFIDICCQAFNILRKNSSVFLNLFGLMIASGIPGLNSDAVLYVERVLLPYLSEAEATAHFAKLIEDSLKSWFTQFNFFIHNLAQLRFTGDHNDGLLLSFIPKVFTMETDGRIYSADVVGSHKRYDPEKYYIYVVKVVRESNVDPMYVLRSYREFSEFHQKICLMFPLAKFRALPRSSILKRSNIREVADKRKTELSVYLQCLMCMAEEIAHCPLVYTFFHPLLRDQDGAPHTWVTKSGGPSDLDGLKDSSGEVQGLIKVSVHYKNQSLFIMIMHAKNLVLKGCVPDAYVKCYLIPDPSKLTKRKTKIVYKNCHPTFMEMLVYRLPYDVVKKRDLQVTVYNYDRVQENAFLGATLVPLGDIDIKKETIKWHKLDKKLLPAN